MLAGRIKAPRWSFFPEDGMLKIPLFFACGARYCGEDHSTADGLVKNG
jgi:hypothetical protein